MRQAVDGATRTRCCIAYHAGFAGYVQLYEASEYAENIQLDRVFFRAFERQSATAPRIIQRTFQ